jgi:hypothetical protein
MPASVELEGKLLLGSNWRGWNLSENVIVEKNVAHQPWSSVTPSAFYRALRLIAVK